MEYLEEDIQASDRLIQDEGGDEGEAERTCRISAKTLWEADDRSKSSRFFSHESIEEKKIETTGKC